MSLAIRCFIVCLLPILMGVSPVCVHGQALLPHEHVHQHDASETQHHDHAAHSAHAADHAHLPQAAHATAHFHFGQNCCDGTCHVCLTLSRDYHRPDDAHAPVAPLTWVPAIVNVIPHHAVPTQQHRIIPRPQAKVTLSIVTLQILT